MIPAIDNDADTSQITWPNSSSRHRLHLGLGQGLPGDGTNGSTVGEADQDGDAAGKTVDVGGKKLLSTWNLITLSISMAGAQIAWTVELGYGTPFLLSLGLSEQLTSLVWLAGPISGLVAQPLIGAISDSSRSKYRRRFWIALSTLVLVISTLILAYCQSIAAFCVDMFGAGEEDWSEERKRAVANAAIGFAVVSFYLLDFALNALQASLRNLLLDVTPPSQLNAGNAWHGRMTHAGNIIGYGFGFLPLASLPIIRLLGTNQFRNFCVICIIILVITVSITCIYHEEVPPPVDSKKEEERSQLKDVLNNIYKSIVELPRPIRRVCVVQLFAFMGWFPFLFYSTTYIGQVMAYEHNAEPDPDYATRTGEFAMLLYSIVAVVAGTLLPHLANRDRDLIAHKGDEDEDTELSRLRNTVYQWKVEAARKGKPLRLPIKPFLLRNIWTGALLLFSLLTFSTFFVETVAQATALVSLVGICWSVAVWVPFAIIMELLKDLPQSKPSNPERPLHVRSASHPHLNRQGERQPLLRRRSIDQSGAQGIEESNDLPVAGGTILGIHNLAIVMPQFIVAVVSSAIFKAVDEIDIDPTNPDSDNTYLGKNGVAWVLRFGGLCTLLGAIFARMVPPTPTEKDMRRRLAEMKLLKMDPALA